MQWFKVPQKIYFERNCIQYLRSCKTVGKVFIVTDKSMVELGFLKKIIDELAARRNPVTYQLFSDVEPDGINVPFISQPSSTPKYYDFGGRLLNGKPRMGSVYIDEQGRKFWAQ